MIAVLNGCGMIMILPEGPFPILSLIKFLPGSPCYQLDRIWYNITLLIINGKKMDVVGCNSKIQYGKAIAPFCLRNY